VLVTGADGFVGQRVVSWLTDWELVPSAHIRRFSLPDGDLRSASDARWAVSGCDVILHLAADVGNLQYSSAHSADQYFNCTSIDLAVVEAARRSGAGRMIVTSCATAYPASASSPLTESNLFEGLPRESHFGYGLAKRNAVALALVYARQAGMSISAVIPSNGYGPGDHFDETSHAVASLIAKCCSGAGKLEVWGDGTPVRDFVYIDDLVVGLLLAAEHLAPGAFVNIGSGVETSVRTLVEMIVKQTGFSGPILFNRDLPNGEPRRSVELAAAARDLGYTPEVPLEMGLQRTIEWYRRSLR
jgi:GDP-L-fucose synthase